jgi:hypothetical protein
VSNLAAWSIANPALALAYERRSGALLSLDCWCVCGRCEWSGARRGVALNAAPFPLARRVDVAALDSRNPVQEVCRRGFAMPSGGGLPFTTGNIRFDMDGPGACARMAAAASSSLFRARRRLPATPARAALRFPPPRPPRADAHQYLLCTVAVGRSFVQDDASAAPTLPSGYDSVYLHATADGRDGVDGSDLTSGENYRHTYVVFDSAQVIPRFVVHFSYHPRERMLRQPQKPINLAEIKARVADALSLLGPAAPAATEKMLSDIGACGGARARTPPAAALARAAPQPRPPIPSSPPARRRVRGGHHVVAQRRPAAGGAEKGHPRRAAAH